MPAATVTFNGRITLPPHVRKQLGLKTGDTVEFVEVEKGRFSILPGPASIESARSWAGSDHGSAHDEELDEVFQ
ncbi:MAG TPA: AbrB/MazE/SpoVT family DNA-binding domain-containing protein [Terracidiphilus sp.]|nr:AbrB/MazE/SpoVT family DNA-binding domain-containing protein [Terracidiphilus sp.]